MRRVIAAGAALSAGLYAVLSTVAPAGATTVSAATAAAPASSGAGADPGASRALARLRADADKPLSVHDDGSGRVTFVGTRPDDTIDNPTVTSSDGPVAAARRDLDRYGAALGLDDGDAGMRTAAARHAVSGGTVVRFDQTVGGLPVIGGQVVVSLDDDGGTSSILSTTSAATRTSSARVGRAAAAATAVGVTARDQGRPAGTLRATDGSLALFDPATFGVSDGRSQTVRKFEVTNGNDVRETVLIDAVTGAVTLHVDDVQTLNRKVCDRNDVRGAETNCTSNPARQEGDPSAGHNADVNDAYDLSGEVSDFYQQISGGAIDLTSLIGFSSGGSKVLGSTVRYCETVDAGSRCPYDNAFWNGHQMFYGKGYADADDVVGHEMTHGVIERTSNLFYYFQSGAINESLADVMGEIVDHRNGPPNEELTWTMGEDLPGGAVRNVRFPTQYGQPDKMTSTFYDADTQLTDSGGVHTDSGVGNKTFYLISQGGTFNGQTITGIDGNDKDLTKTATLYLDVIEKLTSGSDYADLGRQLQQSCADLVGTHGFTSDDCTNVGKAVTATELTKQPTVAGASTPTDAPQGCPAGQTKDELLNSEGGSDPADKFTTFNGLWTRAPGALDLEGNPYPVASNAVTGDDSWFGLDPDPQLGDPSSSSIVAKDPITVPAGGTTYLRFDHWYAFDFDVSPRKYYDGGVVLVDDTGDSSGAQQTSALPWVNGPTRTIHAAGAAVTGFGGVSNGYTSSRLDLSSYAGRTIKPQFQVRGDASVSLEGWYLDDIEVYTCGAGLPSRPTGVSTSGGVGSASVSWSPPSFAGDDGVSGYRVTGSTGLTRDVSSTTRSTTFSGLSPSTSYTFTVSALNAEHAAGPAASVTATGTKFSGLTLARTGTSATKVSGRLLNIGSVGLGAKIVQVQRKAANGTWSTVAKPKTDSSGHLAVTVSGRSTMPYRLQFLGGPGLIGGSSGSKHL